MDEGSPVITDATVQIGRATINALVRRGIRPTALIRGSAQLEGCATISDWLVSDRAVAAIERAPTVVHLAGTLNPADRGYERANIVPRQYRVRAKPFDVRIVAGDAKRDASRRRDGRCDPIRVLDASRPAPRDACLAPPVGRPGAFEPALSPI